MQYNPKNFAFMLNEIYSKNMHLRKSILNDKIHLGILFTHIAESF